MNDWFPDCPNELKNDATNLMLGIVGHSFSKGFKFLVMFANSKTWNWVDARIVHQLEPKHTLREYLIKVKLEKDQTIFNNICKAFPEALQIIQ